MNQNWHIKPFDVKNASPAEYRAANELQNILRAETLPDDPPIPLEEQTRSFQNIPAFVGIHAWAVWDTDASRAIARGVLSVMHLDTNKHIGEMEIDVLPEYRRQGIARALLARIAHAARQENRTLLYQHERTRSRRGGVRAAPGRPQRIGESHQSTRPAESRPRSHSPVADARVRMRRGF